MKDFHDLERFIEPQDHTYSMALQELQNGRKVGHWMWFIFPQLRGLGASAMADYYGIQDLNEARAYLHHPVLGKRLIKITHVLLDQPCRDPHQIFGFPDDLKLRSSMTLFSKANPKLTVFQEVLDVFYNGEPDSKTLRLLQKHKSIV